jgi:anti-sigma factor RsiW
MKRTKNKTVYPSDGCKRYAQAITDYVLGEETDVPKEELMTHIKQCAKCHKELSNWQDFHDMLRVKEYHSRPEVKEKWDRFIRELTAPAPACVPTDVGTGRPDRPAAATGELNLDEKVGTPAGILWQALAKNGAVNILDLPQVSQLEPPKAYSAFGWLAHEKKVVMRKEPTGTYVYLTPAEKEKYLTQAKV